MSERLDVQKTYKLFIGGSFPRSESGRTFAINRPDGSLLANVSQASRKDLRDAVRAARGAQAGWAGRTAYNRGQILYRVAEVMEGRRAQFAEELRNCGLDARAARREVGRAIDRWVWYAGWCDKFHQVAGTVNPVAGPYFNFTVPEPTGVVGVIAPDSPSLLGLVSRLAPVLVSGNTAIVLAGQVSPLAANALAEVLATSDVPGGVVNILMGDNVELLPWLLGHRDINAVDLTGAPTNINPDVIGEAADNVKRLVRGEPDEQSPYIIGTFCEMKTIWHPIGR
jgi:acyl-CoA reductase-like NAD-dependent aldehyde dehydrogenase